MERYLIEDGASNPRKHLEASIAWLESMGGSDFVNWRAEHDPELMELT